MFPLVIYVAILPAGLEGYRGDYWDWAPLRPQQLHGGLNYGGHLGVGFGQQRGGEEDMSSGGIPSRCWEAPAVVGRCRAAFPRWSYTVSRGCFEFNYGGCEGTGNNFGSFSECMAT